MLDALEVLFTKGWAFIAAVAYAALRVERYIADNRKDIEALKSQRTEDLHRIEKVLDDIRLELRGFHKDLKDLLAKH